MKRLPFNKLNIYLREKGDVEVLGGQHGMRAFQELHAKYPNDPRFKTRECRLYLNLTDEEAVYVSDPEFCQCVCKN